jgi:hypothetical protein
MLKRAHINFPSNKKELGKITPEHAMAIVQTNINSLQHGMAILGSMMGIGNLVEMVRNTPPIMFPANLNGNRKAVTSIDEVVQILRAMVVECEKPSCMTLLDAGRKVTNGQTKDFYSIDVDDIEPNKRKSIYMYYTHDGRYNFLFTVGKSVRGR